MRFLKVFFLSLFLIVLISLILQMNLTSKDIRYSLLAFDNKSNYQSIYSPSASSVKISLMGRGHAILSIRDVELNQTIYSDEISGNSALLIIFPHPGYYEFLMETKNGKYSISLISIEAGFPTKNWNVHFFFASLMAFILAFLVWREEHDS